MCKHENESIKKFAFVREVANKKIRSSFYAKLRKVTSGKVIKFAFAPFVAEALEA